MKKKISIDSIFTLIGAAYVIFAILPLIKSLLFNKNNVTYENKEEWVNVPFIIEE